MKKVGVAVVAGLAIIIASYYPMGVVTERTLRKNILLLEKTEGIKADITHYKRGYFSSTADIAWHIVPNATLKTSNSPQPISFNSSMKIYHGPFIFSPKGLKLGMGYTFADISLPNEAKQSIENKLTADSVIPVLHLDMLVSYFKKMSIHAMIPPFVMKSKDDKPNFVFDWKGLESSLKVSDGLKAISIDLSNNGLEATQDMQKVSLGAWSFEGDNYLTDYGFYAGEFSFDFPSLSVKRDNQDIAKLDAATMSSEGNVSSGLYEASVNVGLKQLILMSKQYGPMTLKIAVKNLDAETLGKAQELMIASNGASQEVKQQKLFEFLPQLPKLLSKGASFDMNEFHLTMPEGDIDSDIHIRLPEMSDSSVSPIQLAQKISGNGSLSVSEHVLKTYIMQYVMHAKQDQHMDETAITDKLNADIQKMISSGLLIKDGDKLSVKFEYAEGQMKVNDKPFNPSMLPS